MNLSNYLSGHCGGKLLVEAIRSRDVEKATQLISNYLRKRKIYTNPMQRTLSIKNKNKLAITVFNESNQGAIFIWDLAASSQVESILFTSDYNQMLMNWHDKQPMTMSFDVYVESKGANTVQMCKLVEAVLTGKVKMNPADVRKEIMDAQLFENESFEESPSSIEVNEAGVDPHIAELRRKKQNMYTRIYDAKKKGKDVSSLQAQYDEIVKELAEASNTIQGNVQATMIPDQEELDIDAQFEDEERATPEERFDDMKNYIYNVITGVRPLALLCGAPGVGKTFRVMQTVKGTGKQKDVDYCLLKGKCTPTELYKKMFEFNKPGQLLIMDDCDSVFKDPDAVNLLKAAFDSSDERWVSWGIANPIPAPEELSDARPDELYFDSVKGKWFYPKQFLYEGGGIIITNFSAGQIDTAVRNRALICDLSFTVDEVLNLIEGLMPKINAPGATPASKQQALDYLREMAAKKLPVELSIRSFTLCAGLYASNAPEKSIKRMINEQMRLQFARGGRKY